MAGVEQLQTEERIEKVLAHLKEVRLSKGNDYGPAYLRHGINGLVIRLWDKYARLENLTVNNVKSLVKTESVKDTLLDMVNYGLLAVALLLQAEEQLVEEKVAPDLVKVDPPTPLWDKHFPELDKHPDVR